MKDMLITIGLSLASMAVIAAALCLGNLLAQVALGR
jgi:hypothetical protein